MGAVSTEVTLYGLEHHLPVIDQIIHKLDIEAEAFDVRLILVEAVTNAYYHGNRSDCTKPIHLRYLLEDRHLHIQVEDCGDGMKQVTIPEEMDHADLLEDGGRGLYLIRCFSDSVKIVRNTLHISKILGRK